MNILTARYTVAAETTMNNTRATARSFLSKPILLLFALSCIIYANTLINGFALDDITIFTQNKFVQRGVSGIPDIINTPRLYGYNHIKDNTYRPVSLIVFAIEKDFFGNNPVVGHLLNILLFAGCVIVFFLFLSRLMGGRGLVPFAAALLFALHPVHTEVVANIKSSDELLCFFFGMLALIFFIDYAHSNRRMPLLAGASCLALAFFSRETVISFLFLVPLIFFFYINDNKARSRTITIATLAVAALYLAVRWQVLSRFTPDPMPLEDNGLLTAPDVATRVATAIGILGRYLRLLFVPWPLISSYSPNVLPLTGFGDPLVLASVAAYLGLAVFAGYRLVKKQRDEWAFGILFFLSTIALFSNIPFLIGAEMAERFLFFCSAGFCIVAALSLSRWLHNDDLAALRPGARSPGVAVLFVVCLLYGGLVVARNRAWKDDLTLFSLDVEKSPDDRRLLQGLARTLMAEVYPTETDSAAKQEILARAITSFKKVAEIDPGVFSNIDVGKAYSVAGRYDSAERYFRQALSYKPGHPAASAFLADACERSGKAAEAVALYKVALANQPMSVKLLNSLGRCYLQLSRFDSALAIFSEMRTHNPGLVDLNFNLGMAYLGMSNNDSARACLQREVALNPTNMSAMNNLAAVYYKSADYRQAAGWFQKIVETDARNVLAWSNMGHCYFKLASYDTAIMVLNRSLKIDPSYEPDIVMLRDAYRATGKPDYAKKCDELLARLEAARGGRH